MNQIIQNILSRRSVRKFKTEQIKAEALQIILQAGQYAPSGMGQQSWHFTVIQKSEVLNKINETAIKILAQSKDTFLSERGKRQNYNLFHSAPTLIIVSADPASLTPQPNAALALGNMFLAARSLNIGSCWVHFIGAALNEPVAKNLLQELGIPDKYIIYGSGAFGYPEGNWPLPAPRKEQTINIVS